MAITCALGPDNIAALAKVIYKKMSTTPEGEVFDINAYMDYLYEKISEKQGRDVALQYMQQIPFLANRIAAKSEDINIDPSINLRELSKSFRDDATGYQTLETRFSDKLSPSTLSAIATYETETPIVEEVEEEPQAPIDNFADPRLKATTALSGTLEQFMTMDPNEKVEGTIEVVDKSKMRIFNVIDRVRGLTKDLGIGNIVTYDGTEIALKVVRAAEIGREDRTPQTDALIGRMIGLKDRQSDVTSVDELFALVITDRKGKPLFFDEQGNISSKAAGGKPVYQMMRDARLVNGRYTVRNIYNTEDQIITPEAEATNMIRYMGYKSIEEYEADNNKKFSDLVKETDDRQQAEFKELYDLKQNAIKKKAPLLNITGASAGVVNSRVRKNFKLNALSNFYPEKVNDIIKSFTVLTTDSLGFRSGATIISLDGQPFQVDRVDITEEQAMKIAQALNDPNLSNNRKLKYYSQFYNDLNQNKKYDADPSDTSFVTSVARHRVIRGDKGAPIFVYSKYTAKELQSNKKLVNKKKELVLDGSKEAINKVYEILMNGKSSVRDGVVKKYPAKIDYIDAMFNQNVFYDYQDGKLVEKGTYKDFILSLDGEVMINKTNGIPLYNSYLKFAIQDTFSKKVTKAEEETNVDTRSAIRKFKDDLVDVIKNSPEQSVKATIVSSTLNQNKQEVKNSNVGKIINTYTLQVEIEGQEGTHTMYRSTLNPTKEDVIVLTVKDNVSNGLVYKDVITGRVNGNYAGVLTERDINNNEPAREGIPIETITAAQTLDAEELNDIKPQPATVPEGQAALDDQNSINPENTSQPTDSTPVSRAFKRDYSQFLDRSGTLNNDVTAKQIADATTWWENSPLSKFIKLEHVANIVNSNVYARFIAAGSSLLAEQNLNGKLGKILINDATKGSMVDAYHEAWHVFSQLFLTREQKTALYDEIRKSAPKFANMSNLDIEEELAEDFRSYAINPKAATNRPVRNSLFRKILNFIRGLFGKTTSIADDIVPNKLATYGVAGELFEKLYLASNNPELLNDYEPLIDNVQFDLLNRGVRQERNTKEDALNERDSNDLVEAIDSVLSETIDNTHDYKKFKGEAFTTSSINILLNPRQKEIAYGFVRDEFVDEIESIKKQLNIKPAVSFNSLTTKKELSDSAAAVITSKKGDDKYIFLSSQIDDFSELTLNDKRGTRIKGELFKDDIEIIGDFYSHKTIMSNDKTNADIIIVNSLEEAQAQFDSYNGKDLSLTAITINPTVGTQATDLDYDQQNLLDRLRILQIAVDNWNSVLKYHREHSSFDLVKQTYKIQENDPEKSETDQKDAVTDATKGERYDQGVGEKSLTELADKEVIYILKSLFARKKVGDNYEYEYGRLGFKKLANFKKVWNGVVRATDGTKDPREMYNRIRAAAVNFPELQQLVDYKIPNPAVEDAKNNTSFDITTSFWNAFSLQRVPYMQLSIFADSNGATTEVTNTSIDVTNTIRKFQGKFAAQTDSPYVSKDRNNNNVLNLERIVKDFSDSSGQLPQDKTFEFLTTIGFKYDDIKAIKDEINTVNKRPYYSIDYLFKVLKDFNNVANKPGQSDEAYEYINAFKRAPLSTLMKGIPAGVVGLQGSTLFLAGSKQSTAINRLITLQNRYGSTGSNFSVLNAAKKRVNEHTSDNSLTVITSAINSVKNKTELYVQGSVTSYLNPVRNPWTNSLLTMKSLFDATNERREGRSLVVEMTSGTQVIEKGRSTNESTTTDLDERGKFIQEFHTLLKAGLIEVLRPGSKSSSFAWKIDGGIVNAGIGTKGEDYLYVDFKTFVDAGAEREMIEDIFIPYISSEVQRINIFKTNPEAKNYGGYNKKGRDGKPSGEQFNYFDGILTKDTKAEILSKVNTTDKTLADYISSDSVLGEKIITEVKEYFRKKTVELDKYMQEAKYIDPKLINKFDYPGLSERRKEALLAKTFMYNSWIHNLETSVLFYGDIAQFDHTKQEFHKRTSGLISNGPRFRTDSDAQLFINDIFNNGTTYASTLPGEYNNFRYNGTINTAVIQEIERDSIYIDSIRKGLTKFYETKTLKTAAEIKKTVDREVEKYTAKEIKEGDGQGYITIDAYRTLKKLQKKWTDKQEELYQKVINEQEIDATDIVEFFPVYKLQNFGFVEDTVLPVTAMHKFALMPLIPSMIKGSQMESLHKRMLKENIQYLTFESGSKVGGVTSNAKADSVFNADGSFNENATLTKNTINAGFLKEVTTVPSKYKGKVIFSTQLRKLILDGLYEVGDYTMPQYKSLINAYEKTVKFNTDILKAELIEEIGYEPGKGISNPSKFLQIIKDNLRRKDYPEHLLRTLKTNKDGSLKFDLSYSIDAATIESTIMSIVEKKFVKQFVKGEALVQVASSFTQGMWTAPSDSDAKKYMGSNTLPFYDTETIDLSSKYKNLSKQELEDQLTALKKYDTTYFTPLNKYVLDAEVEYLEDVVSGKKPTRTILEKPSSAMKVAIALQGDFKNLLNLKHNDGKPLGTRLRLNEMIKNDEWLNRDNNRKSVTMTAVRIPVQGINSMEFMEVYEFLDPSAGSIIIVPTEIVAKSGGDFDVDKLTTFMPNINEDGEYVTSDLNEENFFDAYNKTTDPTEKAALMDLQKKAIQNDFIKNIRSILEIPENYANLVRPNDTYILKDVADELEDKVTDIDKYSKVNGEEPNVSGKGKKMISPTTTLEPLYNVGKHGANMIGKSVLGIAANENAFNPVFNQSGVILPKKYKATKYEDGREVEDGDAIFDMRLFLPHNEVNGNISLSTINSADGKYRIADIISQGMNGWVDVEKDEWIFYIQGNLELAPTLLYLIQAGVPVDTAAKFVSQPYIREYAKELKLAKSPIGKVIGKSPKEPQFAQYQALTNVLDKHMKEYFDANMGKYNPNQKITYTVKELNEKGYMEPTVKESTVEGLNNLIASNTVALSDVLDATVTVGDITKNIYVQPSVTNKAYYNATSFATENSTKNGVYSINTLNSLIDKQFKGEVLTADDTIASMGMLLHFNEIQKQIKGIGMMKRRGKPDTNLFRNIQEIILRDLDIEALANNSKVDQVSRAKLFDESITSSLGDKSIVIDVISQLLPLRNSSATNNAIKDVLTSSKKRASVILKYGSTSDGNVKFIEDFKNGITNFILQNYLSNFLDKNGSVVDFPTVFNKMPVKLTKNLPTDVVVKDGAVYVNKEKLDYDFKNKMYLNDSTIPGSYSTREGLAPFKLEQDPFPTKESYYRYAVERAYLESQGYTDLELNRLAMINSYNYDAIMKNNEFSYSNAVMDMINAHPNLASTYPILDQISTSTTSGGMNVLTLNDRSVIDGSTKDTYANNIRALANPRIQKVKDPVENARISSLFSMFPLMSVYQHGVGTTNSGFDQVLPQDMIQSTMEKASNLFKLNYWDSRTLDLIKNKLLKDGSKYPNFVATAAEFNAKKVEELPEVSIEDPTEFITPSASVEVGTEVDTRPRYMFNVEPKQKADEKAKIKASIATQYIGFGEGITGSSTAIYAEQAGRFANTGTYGPEDLIFVSVPGRRGNAETAKAQQNKTIREAIQALESGSTIITDNKNYIDNNNYNTGEKRLWENLNAKGYNYTEKYVQGQRLGFWKKKEFEEVVEPTNQINTSINSEEFEKNLNELLNKSLIELEEANKNGEKYILGFHGGPQFDIPSKSKQYTGEFRNFDIRRIAESMGSRYENMMLFYTDEQDDELFNYDTAIKYASGYALRFGNDTPTVYAYLIPIEEADFTDRGVGEVGLSYTAIENGKYKEVGRTGFERSTQPSVIETPKQTEVTTTDEFKYFGTMYTIKLDSGLGVDVEGYKGKISAKEKLLAAYNNNPNVDPQNGKPFRVLQTPEEIVEQPKGKFKFADGTTIGVPFELNKEQVTALYTLEDFYNNPEKYENEITLSGYAGTGKTTIIGIFDKYLKKQSRVRPRYTSPTNRANAVTKLKNPSASVITLHKLFGLNPMLDLESADYDLKNTKTQSNKAPEVKYGDLLIIDESSMITNQLYDLINTSKEDYNLKIIYAGDRGQLGPVQEEDNVLSRVFDNVKNQVQLTKVERTGDNPILLNSTRAREGKDFTYVSDEIDGSGVEFFDKENRLNQVIGENINDMYDSKNMLHFRILTATNNKAVDVNNKVRRVVFGEKADTEAFIKDEILMGYDTFGDVINSGDYMITQVGKTKTKIITVPVLEYSNGNITQTGSKKFTITGNDISAINLLTPDDPNEIYVFAAIPGIEEDVKLGIAKAVKEINLMYQYATGRTRGILYGLIESVKEQFALFEPVKENKKTLLKNVLGYGYAHTIHKSQGGTYNNVLILESGIKPLANYIANKRKLGPTAQVEVERQLKYVAISRASNYAYVYTGSDVTSSTSTDDLQEVVMSPDDPTVATFNFLDPVPEVPTKGSLPMLQSNIDKIFSGEKIITNRTTKINDGDYSLGDTTSVASFRYIGTAKIDQSNVTIVNENTGKVVNRTLDVFAKAEGFKNAQDFVANNKFSVNFLNGTQSRFIYEVKPVDATANDVAGTTGRLSPETNPELNEFQQYLAANGGVYPKTFTASNGRTYVMNSDNLYDLVDNQDGIVVGRNINLETGDVNEDTGFKEPATASYKKKTISDIEAMKKDFNLEEVLGNKGYDVNELIEQIQNAETMEEVNKIKALINRSIC